MKKNQYHGIRENIYEKFGLRLTDEDRASVSSFSHLSAENLLIAKKFHEMGSIYANMYLRFILSDDLSGHVKDFLSCVFDDGQDIESWVQEAGL